MAFVVAAFSTGTVLDASGQQDDLPFPIQFQVEPELVVVIVKGPNRSSPYVQVKGVTLPFEDERVRYHVDGAPFPLSGTLPVDGAGRFAGRTFAPMEGGKYTITLTAPDGKGSAMATVEAVEVEDIEDKAVESLQKAVEAAADAVAAVEAKIEDLPHSPVVDAARQKIAAAKSAVGRLAASPDAAAGTSGLIGAIISHDAFAVHAAEPMQAMADNVAQMARETARVRALTSRMSAADVGCHQIAFSSEVFKFASALLNISRSFLDTAVGLSKDVVSDVASNAARKAGGGEALSFATGQIVKSSAELNRASALAGNAQGILADVGVFMSDTAFGLFCEQFVGPVSASMKAEFTEPTRWWSYSFSITGRLMLYYPKSAKGDSIRLHGRIEGFAHGFQTEENALGVLFPGLMSSAILMKRQYPPLEIGGGASQIASQGAGDAISAYVEGSAAALALPGSFLIDVTGVLEKSSLSLMLGSALSDFNAVHRVVAIVLSPLALSQGIRPILYELPFKNAHHLFQRVSGGQAMRLDLKTTNALMAAEGSFRASSGSGGAHGEYTASVRACNPACAAGAAEGGNGGKM